MVSLKIPHFHLHSMTAEKLNLHWPRKPNVDKDINKYSRIFVEAALRIGKTQNSRKVEEWMSTFSHMGHLVVGPFPVGHWSLTLAGLEPKLRTSPITSKWEKDGHQPIALGLQKAAHRQFPNGREKSEAPFILDSRETSESPPFLLFVKMLDVRQFSERFNLDFM